MPNQLIDNTYLVDAAAATALTWPGGARVSQVRITAVSTAADVLFQIAAGTPILRFTFVGSTATAFPTHFVFPMGGVGFRTAWIPSILVAATAWIDFA